MRLEPTGSGRYMRMTRFASTEEAERNAPRKKPRAHFLPVTQHVLLPEGNVKCRVASSIPVVVVCERPKVDRAIF